MEKNVRLRVLLVMEILFERTDEDHGVNMSDILQWLEISGIAGERKSIYEDLHALQKYGLNIEYNNEDKTYRLMERQMELAELKLLVDAIHASKFITQKRSEEIIQHIMSYASCYKRDELKREVYSEKPKAANASGYYSLDTLHKAIGEDHQVSFKYAEWGLDKKLHLRHDGDKYIVSPWLMVWADENYYLVAYDEKKHIIKHFRVDKILEVEILSASREGKESFEKYNTSDYTTTHFGMFGGEVRRVTMQFDNGLIGVVLDRFGTDISIVKADNGTFKITVAVVISNQFYAWIFAFGDKAQILDKDVASDMVMQLKEALALYK